MTPLVSLFRDVPASRRFFFAHLQSSLGNGMGYVALVLIALERFHSSWAVALVLIADLLPLMLLGPVLGGAADHLPRRACAVGADLLRAAAFLGIAFVDDISATLALAALAGVGNGLFNPAVLSGMPRLVGEAHLPAATSLFGAVSTLGRTVGPLLAAAALLGGGAEVALVVNGLSFLVSAALLLTLDLGRAERVPAAPEPTVDGDDRAGWRLGPGFRRLVIGSSGAALFAGMANVAEPSFITGDLASPGASFSVMVGLYFIGVAGGSLLGARGGGTSRLWSRYLAGIAAMGAGYAAAALAPVFLACLPGFILAGFGNGLLMVHERLLVQTTVDEGRRGRAFGVLDMCASWAFAAALALGAAAVALGSARAGLLLAGLGTIAVWGACAASTVARGRRLAPAPGR